MKVLFAGTPDFAVMPLQALAKEHDIVGVFTQPDRKSGRGKKLTAPPVKLAAQTIFATQNLGAQIHQPNSLKDQVELIANLKPDVMVVVAYGMLLPQPILDIPKLGCINIHASLLPRWRGAAPIHRAIEAGDSESGVAIMKMELGLDTGPVFEMLKTPILDTDTTASLHDKLTKLGSTGICNTLRRLQKNPQLEPTAQDNSLATYAKKLRKEEANINWSLSACEIHQKIRAFVPFPIAQCTHGDTRLRIWQAVVVNEARVSETDSKTPAGQILAIHEQGLDVQCGQGILRLQTLQRDGSKALAWQHFANGYSMNVGDLLN